MRFASVVFSAVCCLISSAHAQVQNYTRYAEIVDNEMKKLSRFYDNTDLDGVQFTLDGANLAAINPRGPENLITLRILMRQMMEKGHMSKEELVDKGDVFTDTMSSAIGLPVTTHFPGRGGSSRFGGTRYRGQVASSPGFKRDGSAPINRLISRQALDQGVRSFSMPDFSSFSSAVGGITDLVNGVGAGIGNFMTTLNDTFAPVIDFANSIGDVVSGVSAGINNILEPIRNGVSSISGLVGAVRNTISMIIGIPEMAFQLLDELAGILLTPVADALNQLPRALPLRELDELAGEVGGLAHITGPGGDLSVCLFGTCRSAPCEVGSTVHGAGGSCVRNRMGRAVMSIPSGYGQGCQEAAQRGESCFYTVNSDCSISIIAQRAGTQFTFCPADSPSYCGCTLRCPNGGSDGNCIFPGTGNIGYSTLAQLASPSSQSEFQHGVAGLAVPGTGQPAPQLASFSGPDQQPGRNGRFSFGSFFEGLGDRFRNSLRNLTGNETTFNSALDKTNERYAYHDPSLDYSSGAVASAPAPDILIGKSASTRRGTQSLARGRVDPSGQIEDMSRIGVTYDHAGAGLVTHLPPQLLTAEQAMMERVTEADKSLLTSVAGMTETAFCSLDPGLCQTNHNVAMLSTAKTETILADYISRNTGALLNSDAAVAYEFLMDGVNACSEGGSVYQYVRSSPMGYMDNFCAVCGLRESDFDNDEIIGQHLQSTTFCKCCSMALRSLDTPHFRTAAAANSAVGRTFRRGRAGGGGDGGRCLVETVFYGSEDNKDAMASSLDIEVEKLERFATTFELLHGDRCWADAGGGIVTTPKAQRYDAGLMLALLTNGCLNQDQALPGLECPSSPAGAGACNGLDRISMYGTFQATLNLVRCAGSCNFRGLWEGGSGTGCLGDEQPWPACQGLSEENIRRLWAEAGGGVGRVTQKNIDDYVTSHGLTPEQRGGMNGGSCWSPTGAALTELVNISKSTAKAQLVLLDEGLRSTVAKLKVQNGAITDAMKSILNQQQSPLLTELAGEERVGQYAAKTNQMWKQKEREAAAVEVGQMTAAADAAQRAAWSMANEGNSVVSAFSPKPRRGGSQLSRGTARTGPADSRR